MERKIKIGTRRICKSCGEEIAWLGLYWGHTTTSPRHPGVPKSDPVSKNEITIGATTIEELNEALMILEQEITKLRDVFGDTAAVKNLSAALDEFEHARDQLEDDHE